MSQGAVHPFDGPSGEQRLSTNATQMNRLLSYWARCQDVQAFNAGAPNAGRQGSSSKLNAKWVIRRLSRNTAPFNSTPLVNYLLLYFTHLSLFEQSKSNESSRTKPMIHKGNTTWLFRAPQPSRAKRNDTAISHWVHLLLYYILEFLAARQNPGFSDTIRNFRISGEHKTNFWHLRCQILGFWGTITKSCSAS